MAVLEFPSNLTALELSGLWLSEAPAGLVKKLRKKLRALKHLRYLGFSYLSHGGEALRNSGQLFHLEEGEKPFPPHSRGSLSPTSERGHERGHGEEKEEWLGVGNTITN